MYTLILTDINMPEMDGLQMTKIIRKFVDDNRNSNTIDPVIWAVTAMNETEIED